MLKLYRPNRILVPKSFEIALTPYVCVKLTIYYCDFNVRLRSCYDVIGTREGREDLQMLYLYEIKDSILENMLCLYS